MQQDGLPAGTADAHTRPSHEADHHREEPAEPARQVRCSSLERLQVRSPAAQVVGQTRRPKDDEADALAASHQSTLTVRSRNELAMTLTEDRAIAAAATTGDSSTPKKG